MAGHSSLGIRWPVYSYLMPSDEEVGGAAMTKTMSTLVVGGYPLWSEEVAQ
jgi:hypothetical protein